MSEPVTIIVLAKPDGVNVARRAQLALLAESLQRYWPGQDIRACATPAGPIFEKNIRVELATANRLVCFMCDDGVLIRPVLHSLIENALADEQVLCYSLRYGKNTTHCYPNGCEQAWPGYLWDWREEAFDFGYPGSVDAHVFRRQDLEVMLSPLQSFPEPTSLECVLDSQCRMHFGAHRFLIASPSRSRYVGIPVNRVSDQSGVRAGDEYPQSVAELARRYDAGERIDLDAIDVESIDGPHCEIEFQWRAA